MASVYSAGSASVQVVPDFSGAQTKIGQWFAKQRDLKIKVDPDLDQTDLLRMREEISHTHADIDVGIDKKKLAKDLTQAVDFLTGTSSVGKALKTLFDVKPILLTNLAGAGVALGSALGQELTQAVGGAAAMLPALSASLAVPIGTAVLGAQHVGDAFKNIAGTTPAQAKALAAAMKELAPSARDFVTQVHALGPAFTAMRLDVQQHLFAGLGASVSNLGHAMLPMLQEALKGTATELDGVGKSLMAALSSDKNVNDFAATIDNINQALHNVGQAAAPLWSVFANLATVGSTFLPGLTKGVGDLAQKFADFVQKARDTGALHDFIASSMDGLKQIIGVVGNLGSVLKSVFTTALPAGQVLMKILDMVSGDLATFFKTAQGQNSLSMFFDGVTKSIGAITPGLETLVQALVTSVLPAMAGLAQVVAPIANTLLVQFADLLRTLGPLFYPALANAMATALGALTPLMSVFAHLAQTVLPIVIDAIQRMAPLFTELAEGIGGALVRAIDALAPALPGIVQAIEAIVQAAVPFILQITNLAVDLLPPFVAILDGVAKALQFLAPILPIVAMGFLAIKAAAGLSALLGMITNGFMNMAVAADTAATSTLGLAQRGLAVGLTNAAGGAERLGVAAKGMGAALGVVGVAAGVVMMAMEASKQQTDEFAQSLLKGGQAARDAAKQMADPSIWDQVKWGFGHIFSADGYNTKSISENMTAEAKKAADETFKAMDPLAQAQSKVAYWQNEINYRRKEFGEQSPQYEAAQRRFGFWSEEVARQQGLQADATKTATDRLKEQADQERASVDTELALEQATLGVHSAMDQYNKVMADGKATDDDRAAASIGVRQAILGMADAARKKAEADNAGKDATAIADAGDQAYIETLKAQAKLLTGPAADAMNAYITDYENVHGAAAKAQAKIKDLGLTIVSVPDGKTVNISTPTAEQTRQLQALGYEIRYLPDGKVQIITDTAQAKKELDDFVALVKSKNPTMKINVVGNTVVSVGGMGGQGGLHMAGGGIVRAFRDGGFEPMRGGIARVVKPNTWRIIGDRVRDDEAYIPINRDRRSKSILASTASRMGYGLVPNAIGNLLTPPGASNAYSGGGTDFAMTASLREAQRALGGTTVSAPSVAGFVNNGTVVTTDLDELARKSRRGTQRALAVAGL